MSASDQESAADSGEPHTHTPHSFVGTTIHFLMDIFVGCIKEPSSETEEQRSATRDRGRERGRGGGRGQERGKGQGMALEFTATPNDTHSG